jgi:hypothetical protein
MAGDHSREANESIKRAWVEVQTALQAMLDAFDEDRDEFLCLLNALTALKMALEVEEILENDV